MSKYSPIIGHDPKTCEICNAKPADYDVWLKHGGVNGMDTTEYQPTPEVIKAQLIAEAAMWQFWAILLGVLLALSMGLHVVRWL